MGMRLGPGDDFQAAVAVGLMGGLGGNLLAAGLDHLLTKAWSGTDQSWAARDLVVPGSEIIIGGMLLLGAFKLAALYRKLRKTRKARPDQGSEAIQLP